MANIRKLPSDQVLLRWRDEGLTHQQMAERIYAETGIEVARSSISAAITRAGEARQEYLRYQREVPWHVEQQHTMASPIRMLRLLGRRRAGLEMTKGDARRLDAWLQKLDEGDLVVAYAPHLEDGAVYVNRSDMDPAYLDDEVPVFRRPLGEDEIQGPDTPY